MTEAVILALIGAMAGAVAKLWHELGVMGHKQEVVQEQHARCVLETEGLRGDLRLLQATVEQLRGGAFGLGVLTMLDALIVADDAGCVTEWNPAATVLFHYTADEVLGRRVSELIVPPGLRVAHEAGLARVRERHRPPELRRPLALRAMNKEGQEFPVDVSLTGWEWEGRWHFAAAVRKRHEKFVAGGP